MIHEEMLSEVISKDVSLRLVEPDIYSVYSPGEMPGSYDRFGASTIYDLVACNGFYNWLMWGYSIKDYTTLCENALASSSEGWVLDMACGSLAFTAKLYANYSKRPVVLLDQSLHLLRKGKSRLVKRTGKMPANMIFLHANALQMPFKVESFSTIISLNLLHCLDDIKKEKIDSLLDYIEKNGQLAPTIPLKHGLPDPDDEPFLEVAIGGKAECLITGNKSHYPGKYRQGIEILSPSEFIHFYRRYNKEAEAPNEQGRS